MAQTKRTDDDDRIDDALLSLGPHDHVRAWKGFDWGALGRLHAKGLIDDPVGKVKSVVFTEEGLRRSTRLFEAMFTESEDGESTPTRQGDSDDAES